MGHRLAIVFALLAVAVVCLGTLVGVRMGGAGVDIAWNHSSFIFSRIPPWYFVGGWLAVCALLYAFVLSGAQGRLGFWHFWLTASGSATSLVGLAALSSVLGRGLGMPDPASKLLLASMIAFSLAGPAMIFIGQLFLVAGLIQRIRRHISPALA